MNLGLYLVMAKPSCLIGPKLLHVFDQDDPQCGPPDWILQLGKPSFSGCGQVAAAKEAARTFERMTGKPPKAPGSRIHRLEDNPRCTLQDAAIRHFYKLTYV